VAHSLTIELSLCAQSTVKFSLAVVLDLEASSRTNFESLALALALMDQLLGLDLGGLFLALDLSLMD